MRILSLLVVMTSFFPLVICNLREANVDSEGDIQVNADNILIQNSQLTSDQNLAIAAQDSLVLEDMTDQSRGDSFSSDQPLQLIAGNNLSLNSEGDILRAIVPKTDSIFQAGNQLTVTSDWL